MEDQPPAKKAKASDSQHKLKIVEVFNEIINQVDIDAEVILMRINQNVELKPSIKKETEKEINQTRKLLIDRISDMKNTNLDNLKKTTDLSEQPLEDLFIKYCVYLNSDTVRSFTFNKDRLGILVETDFYINDSQVKNLSKMVSSVLKIDFVDIMELEKTSIDKGFMENFVILSKLKSLIFSDTYIMEFTSNLFNEISQIKIIRSYVVIKGLNEVFKRFSGLKTLDLEYVDLHKENRYEIGSLEKLNLNCCDVEQIRNFQFQGLRNLKVLELKNNNLETIEPKAFYDLPHLEKLDISYNSLENLPDNVFSKLSNLKFLDLSYNLLKLIKKSTLNGLHKLEYFRLAHREYDVVFEKDTFKNLDSLKHVEIRRDVSSDDYQIDPPKNLETADLCLGPEDTSLINWLNSAKNLKKFTISCEDETITSPIFKNCHNLEELAMEYVKLNFDVFPADLTKLKTVTLTNVEFPKNTESLFSSLKKLEHVEIVYCRFSNDFDKRKLFQNLKGLKKLTFKTELENILPVKKSNKKSKPDNTRYLRESILRGRYVSVDHIVENHLNMIELDLSSNFSTLSGLKYLNKMNYLESLKLADNSIKQLSDEFNGMVALKHLDLSSNKLAQIDDNVFSSDLKNLTVLNLEENNLKIISNGMFSSLVNLEKLNLHRNEINKIEENSFKGLVNLKNLNLSRNSLKELDNELFQDLTNLTDLDLSINEINSVDNLFENNTKLESLILRYSQIESVNFKQLAKLVNLNLLDLTENLIKNFDLNEINYFVFSTNVNLKLDDYPALGSNDLQNFLRIIKFK